MALDLTTADNGDITLRVPRQIAPKYTQELDIAYERIADYSGIIRELYESNDTTLQCTIEHLMKNHGVTHEDLGIANSNNNWIFISHKEASTSRPIITCGGCGMPVTNCCCG